MGVSEAREARGARGLKKYMQGSDIRVYQTHSSQEEATEGEERKKSFWSKKKFLIPAISVIFLLFIALTIGVSLYFSLYYGRHDSQGDYCKLSKV